MAVMLRFVSFPLRELFGGLPWGAWRALALRASTRKLKHYALGLRARPRPPGRLG